MKSNNTDPISRLAEFVMNAFATAAANATHRSEFALARDVIGEDRYLDVVVAGLREHMKAALLDPTHRDALRSYYGDVAAQAIIATIVAETIDDVIEAGREVF